jgi:predicted nuclease of predicted toxin-antitoxin system
MSLSLLLDENIEHEALHRLENYDHDVEHIDLHDDLRKGDPDRQLARYSIETERIIVSYDTDWVTEFSEDEYYCALVVDDQSLSAQQVAQIVHNMSEVYPESEFVGLQKVGRNWL